MLCVCLADLSFEACLDAAKNYQLIELRLDRLKLCASELQEIFYQSAKVICTYKQDNLEAVQTNLSLLEQCLNLGASFIDLDLSTPAAEIKRLNLLAEKLDKKIILSWHSSSITDPQALTEIKLRAQSTESNLVSYEKDQLLKIADEKNKMALTGVVIKTSDAQSTLVADKKILEQLNLAREEVKRDPLNVTRIQNLKSLEVQEGNRAMVQYLDGRIAEINSASSSVNNKGVQ